MPPAVKNFVAVPLTLVFALAAGYWAGPIAHGTRNHLFPEPEYVVGDYSSLFAESGVKVVMFSTSTCPYCTQARSFFDEVGRPYVDHVIDRSQEAKIRYEALGVQGVPAIYIGDRRILGFRKKALQEALDRLNVGVASRAHAAVPGPVSGHAVPNS